MTADEFFNTMHFLVVLSLSGIVFLTALLLLRKRARESFALKIKSSSTKIIIRNQNQLFKELDEFIETSPLDNKSKNSDSKFSKILWSDYTRFEERSGQRNG